MHEPHHTSNEFEASIKREVAQAASAGEQPYENTMEDTKLGSSAGSAGGVRAGSPFRPGTSNGSVVAGGAAAIPAYNPHHDGAASFDIGITASTAFGGLLASYAILPFSAISAIAFPVGAILVSGLGLVLAIFAFASQRPAWTAVALLLHLLLGLLGYFQML